MTCAEGTPANDQTIALPHDIRPYWARGPGAHFGLISFFRSMIFGEVMTKIRHGGGSHTVVFLPFWEVVRCGLFGVTNE